MVRPNPRLEQRVDPETGAPDRVVANAEGTVAKLTIQQEFDTASDRGVDLRLHLEFAGVEFGLSEERTRGDEGGLRGKRIGQGIDVPSCNFGGSPSKNPDIADGHGASMMRDPEWSRQDRYRRDTRLAER